MDAVQMTQNSSLADKIRALASEKSISVLNAEEVRTIKDIASLRCDVCGNEWETAINNVTRPGPKASGCPACAKRSKNLKLLEAGREKFDAYCEGIGYRRISDYLGHFERVVIQCDLGHEFALNTAGNLKSGQLCPTCSGTSQHLNRESVAATFADGTTFELRSSTHESFTFVCRCCEREKVLGWDRVRELRGAAQKERDCECQRYGSEFRKYVDDQEGYALVTPYRSSKENVTMRHEVCGTEWSVKPSNFCKPHYPTRCPKCARSGRGSLGQKEVTKFIRSLGLEVREDVPGLIHSSPRQEVDIFVPSHSVAIEFDGVWWHAEGASREQAGRSRPDAQPDAVTDKTDRLAEAGIRLIRIFSDEWALRRTAVVSRLRAILGCPVEKLNARSLMVDASVPVKEALAFLDDNHVQGRIATASHVAVGLRDSEGSLVALMTFGERSTSANSASAQLELLRFCTRAGTAVRGAAGRLLSAFRENYETDHRTLVSYADIRWSGTGGAFYDVLGFSLVGRTRPSYSYIHPSHSNRRISRISLQKHKLLAANPQFDASMTERQMAEALGYARVWDSGQLRYELRLQ